VNKKVCSKCLKSKPETQFYSYPETRVTQRFSKCMECVREYQRNRYHNRKEAKPERRKDSKLK
jgi:hypothetical protein